ncbi:hypothetical protein EDC04DRAFT_2807237, partial [Pisolithus marmoratus]
MNQQNRAAHDDSAELACKAAGAIRTATSLTCEDDCLKLYSSSLKEPLRNSNRNAIWSNLIYAFSQARSFFSWYARC